MVVSNSVSFANTMKSENNRRIYAGNLAVKVEAYRLRGVFKSEVKAGRPGGRALAPLREVSKRLGKGTLKRAPLQRTQILAQAAFSYNVASKVMKTAEIGYINTFRYPLSASWKRILNLHQEGGTITPTKALRAAMATFGGGYKNKELGKYFFLRKTTKHFVIPRRPIVDPFWLSHHIRSSFNIERNFEMKMAGHRI